MVSQTIWKKNVSSWNRVLKHEDPLQGVPIAVSESPCFERGFRQYWNYKVEYIGEFMDTNSRYILIDDFPLFLRW